MGRPPVLRATRKNRAGARALNNASKYSVCAPHSCWELTGAHRTHRWTKDARRGTIESGLHKYWNCNVTSAPPTSSFPYPATHQIHTTACLKLHGSATQLSRKRMHAPPAEQSQHLAAVGYNLGKQILLGTSSVADGRAIKTKCPSKHTLYRSLSTNTVALVHGSEENTHFARSGHVHGVRQVRPPHAGVGGLLLEHLVRAVSAGSRVTR